MDFPCLARDQLKAVIHVGRNFHAEKKTITREAEVPAQNQFPAGHSVPRADF